MKITGAAKVMAAPNPHHVDARKKYESPHAMAVVINLKPSEELKSISHRLIYSFTSLKDPELLKLAMRNRWLEKTCCWKVRQGSPTVGSTRAHRCSGFS